MRADIYFSRTNDFDSIEGENYIALTPQISIPLKEGMSLYHALQMEGVILSAPCAGNGTCGGCKVKCLKGTLLITDKDQTFLSEKELREGWRLACQSYPKEDCAIYLPTEQFLAVTGYRENKTVEDVLEKEFQEKTDTSGKNQFYKRRNEKWGI